MGQQRVGYMAQTDWLASCKSTMHTGKKLNYAAWEGCATKKAVKSAHRLHRVRLSSALLWPRRRDDICLACLLKLEEKLLGVTPHLWKPSNLS